MAKPKKDAGPQARLPKGFRDLEAGELASTAGMLATIRCVYETYGFEQLETPAIEYTALGFCLLNLIVGSHGIAQDRPKTVLIGRSPESAPLELSKRLEVLADSLVERPDIEDLDSTEPEAATDLKFEDWAHVAVFEGPCHFSERTNDVAKTLVVYEGMQVAVSKDGRYQVSMIAEAPLTSVVIRMQLRVTELVDNVRLDHGTITLAPIVIETNIESSDQQPSNTVRIRRTGYSHLLRRLMIEGEPSAMGLSFSRGGVARFGSIPEAADYSRSFTTMSNGAD